jgi:hypothetical protein
VTHNSVDAIIESLGTFVPSDAKHENEGRLYELLESFSSLPDRGRAMPAMFALLEAYPEADFGWPGPLVHELEALDDYEAELRRSLRRKPTYTTVWMVNRILNSDLSEERRQDWLSELHAVCAHPGAPPDAKEEAREFLDYQLGPADA